MPDVTPLLEAARHGGLERRLDEFGRDPTLTVACVLLIVVSLIWVVMSRVIYRNLRRAAEQRELPVREVRPPRDIWRAPP